jgi:putative tricarboxylic transport membrane protein
MTKADRWIGLLLAALALYVCIESLRLGLGSVHKPGPGFLPFCAAAILGAFSLALVPLAHFKRSGEPEPWHEPGRIVAVFAALLAFGLLLEWLGFVLAAFLFVAFLLRLVEGRGWRFSIGVALAVAAASYLVFCVWLSAQLPLLGIWAESWKP